MIGLTEGASSRALLMLVAVGLSLSLTGCGSRTQPVEGLVVFKGGEPAARLEGYLVTFESTEQTISATGEVQADGTFRVGTYGTGDGAVLGKHRVAVGPVAPHYGPNPVSKVLPKYTQLATSGLEITITRGVNKVVLEVEPARK